MIHKRLSLNEFIEEFKRFDRDCFSYEGYQVLYNHIESIAEDLNEPYLLDVIGLVGAYDEITIDALEEQYEMPIRHIRNHTLVLEVADDIVIYEVF